jgi:micrococcal nuclease
VLTSFLVALPLALLLFGGSMGCSDDDGAQADATVDAAPPPDAEVSPFRFPARVLRIIDGDTIDVSYLGLEIRIRFLGVNAPETSPPAEPYSQEAKEFTAQHAIPAFTIGLEFDDDRCGSLPIPASCYDIYDRLLAYIRTDDLEDLNALLVSSGLARVYTASTCDREAYYLQLQATAQANQLGIWGP